MPGPWKSWTKSLSCKTHSEDHVHSPVSISASALSSSSSRMIKPSRSGTCSRSLSNLKDVIHGNTKVVHKSASCSPAAPAIKRDPLLLEHQRAAAKSDPALAKIYYWSDPVPAEIRHSSSDSAAVASAIAAKSHRDSSKIAAPRRFGGGCHGCNVADEALGAIISRDSSRSPLCARCGASFAKIEALEQHHALRHAVTELGRGDSSKNVVEIIFRTSWLKKKEGLSIERVLKVENTHRTIARFEEYRDGVRCRASAVAKKHARCIADGNELLRFHAAALDCRLGADGSSSICASPRCQACRIIKSGFKNGAGMIHTTATSGRAHDSLKIAVKSERPGDDRADSHAMLVCRVIAGRMHKGFPRSEHGDAAPPSGFDSIAGELGPFSNVDDLYVASSRAVLPCFVVVYRWS